MGGLRMRGRCHSNLHAGWNRNASTIRPGEYRHGLPGCRSDRRAALPARSCDRHISSCRGGIRPSVRSAARRIHRSRRPVSADVRDHAGGCLDHFAPRRKHPSPGGSASGARDRSRDRADSQRAARLDIARSADAARRDGRRVIEPCGKRRAIGRGGANCAGEKHLRPGTGNVGKRGEGLADDASGNGHHQGG